MDTRKMNAEFIARRWREGMRTHRGLDRYLALKKQFEYLSTSQVLNSILTEGLGMDTRALDIHYSGSASDVHIVRSNLFCRVLDDNACEASRRSDLTKPKSKSNVRQTEFYDRLGTDAAAAGALGRDISRFNRRNVALAIQEQQVRVFNKTSLDSPLDCPTRSELEGLLNA